MAREPKAELADVRAKADQFRTSPASPWLATPELNGSDEQDALELVRRVAASDVGNEPLTRLEAVVDELAIAYSKTPPAALLGRIRQHPAYVDRLLDARKTLNEHRRLLVFGGWLSLLAATVHIDLKQQSAASARLKIAASLARHAGHDEIHAWCFETEAWRVLTEGNYGKALELSRTAQTIAPAGSSAAIQATAQEGRAWARLGQGKESYAVIAKVDALVSPLARPDQPEHHYRYDPDKSVAYVATTLAWLGDPAACDATSQAISSGRVVPSNHWRAAEVVRAVEARGLPEAGELREAYEGLRRG